MYQILKQNREKTKYFILFAFIVTFSLLLTVVFKNDEQLKIKIKETNVSFQHEDLTSIKEFLLTLIKSQFVNVNYEIKSGDSIQKILKKLKVKNREIQTVIQQYKKYSNPNQLLTGNKIDIIIEEKKNWKCCKKKQDKKKIKGSCSKNSKRKTTT